MCHDDNVCCVCVNVCVCCVCVCVVCVCVLCVCVCCVCVCTHAGVLFNTQGLLYIWSKGCSV